jgi:hypothetical protein
MVRDHHGPHGDIYGGGNRFGRWLARVLAKVSEDIVARVAGDPRIAAILARTITLFLQAVHPTKMFRM